MSAFLQRLRRARAASSPLSPASSASHPATLVVLASLWLASVCNLPLWRAVAALPGTEGLRGWGFALAFMVLVAAGNAAVIGLLAWGRALKPEEISALVSYVRSLQGSNPPGAKPAEGDPFPPEPLPGN